MSAVADIAALANPTPAEKALADAFAALDAPSAVQRQAWAAFSTTGLPHRRIEGWRWSDVRRAASEIAWSAPQSALSASRAPDSDLVLERAPTEGMPALAGALRGVSAVYTLSDGEILDLNIAPNAGGAHSVAAVIIPAGVSARVTETYAAGAGLANAAVLYEVGAGATLERLVRQEPAGEAVIVATVAVDVAADARLRQTTLAFGAKLARLETHVTVAGSGAAVTLDGASLLAGEAHADHTTVVTHAAPGATTRETFRSVVTDRATGVFQGKIKVERPAQQTDAEMDHKALLLGEGATVNAKPELEIYADDVACAHGNTAGALDAAALHYMRARGLPETRAKALLIEAFVGDVIDGVAHEPTREALRAEARVWMEERL